MGCDINIPTCYRNFLTHLKSKFTTGKGGDSAFKVLPDGSYVNAYTTIVDSFKFIEEAIATANAANIARPATDAKSNRTGTALSGNSKTGRNAAAEETKGERTDRASTPTSVF